jgi:hypothetical protein
MQRSQTIGSGAVASSLILILHNEHKMVRFSGLMDKSLLLAPPTGSIPIPHLPTVCIQRRFNHSCLPLCCLAFSLAKLWILTFLPTASVKDL